MRDNTTGPIMDSLELGDHLQILYRSPFPSNSCEDLNDLNLMGGLDY